MTAPSTNAEQYRVCVRTCQQWQHCNLWLGTFPDLTPAKHCDWWPSGMPVAQHSRPGAFGCDEDANAAYVQHVERLAEHLRQRRQEERRLVIRAVIVIAVWLVVVAGLWALDVGVVKW